MLEGVTSHAHELRGVVFVTWVAKQHKEKALQFPADKAADWVKLIADMTGIDCVATSPRRPDVYPVFDVLPRLWAAGYKTKEQDGEWWLFRDDGEGICSGRDFRGLCVNILLAGI